MIGLLGKVLEEDILSASGVTLLPSGTKVTLAHIHKVLNHQLLADPRTKPVDVVKDLEHAVIQLQGIFDYVRARHQIEFEEVYNEIVPTVLEVSSYPYVHELLALLDNEDDYTATHSFAVSILATMLGRWLGLDEEQLLDITIASALHDIGKSQIPLEILNKPGELTQEEFEVMKQHTLLGYELIQKTAGTTKAHALAALQHHERMDGSGYPAGIVGAEISFYARIIGIADVFHAMGSTRVYHGPNPAYKILDDMSSGVFGKFDPVMMRLFLQRYMEYLIGARVYLSTGKSGTIRMIHTDNPTRPLIQTDDGFVDLSKTWDVNIEKILK